MGQGIVPLGRQGKKQCKETLFNYFRLNADVPDVTNSTVIINGFIESFYYLETLKVAH